MIVKVLLLCATAAVAHATIMGTGLWTSGLMNGGVLTPGWVGVKGIAMPSAMSTGSLVAIPGAVSSEKRVMGASTLLTGVPVMNGLWGNGMLGATPLAWGNGLVAPLGMKNMGMVAAPGMVKAIL